MLRESEVLAMQLEVTRRAEAVVDWFQGKERGTGPAEADYMEADSRIEFTPELMGGARVRGD